VRTKRRNVKNMANKKMAVLALTLILCVGVAFAAYWIYSTVVHVAYIPPQYTLTLDGLQIDDSTIDLAAKLTVLHFGAPEAVPVSGATIHFYLTYENGTIIQEIGTKTTDDKGVAIFDWTVPSPESPATIDYYFTAGYEVTG
jgi:hypothetical protein